MQEQAFKQKRSVGLNVIHGLLLSAVVFATLVLLWNFLIRTYYFPRADNFALLVNSCPPFHPNYSEWVLKGFHNYLYVYPDLSEHSSNFIRPMVNFVFFLNWAIFGAHWAAYLLVNYLIIALLGGMTYFIAEQKLGLGWRLSAATALCVVVAPSIDTASLLDPTFAFDLLCGLLVLCGVLSLISDALISCWIFLMLAIFTKEASLFAPPLAAAIVFLRFDELGLAKRFQISLAFLLPLCAWQFFRWFDFRDEHGLYVLMNRSSHGVVRTMVARLYEGMLTWPVAAMVWDNPSILQKQVERFALGINVVFWIVATVLVWNSAQKLVGVFRKGKVRISDEVYPVFAIGFFCAGSLFMPLILNLPRRFGGVFYPLFFLSLALCVHRAKGNVLKRVAASLMVAAGVCGAYLICSSYQKQVGAARSNWTMARRYVELLSSLHEPVVFSLDDTVAGYSSNQYVAAFAGYRGDMIRVNNLHVDFRCQGKLDFEASVDASQMIRLVSRFPGQCGGYGFDSLFPPLDSGMLDLTRTLPQGTLHYHLSSEKSEISAHSKEMLVEISPKVESGAILYPDFDNLSYKVIPFRLTGSSLALNAPEDRPR
ncbi:hypothetical protein [Granulicella sp. dw_53]|uniref:hypothetical protein n=1 Tax=Granulicella sp. dw_53 TaxID=2719792 RepID=UPI001BD20771|nr:hypothetical protein [Granulicella sp. dw_53]